MIIVADPISTDEGGHFEDNLMMYQACSSLMGEEFVEVISTKPVVEYVLKSNDTERPYLSTINPVVLGICGKITNRFNVFVNYLNVVKYASKHSAKFIIFTGVEEISLCILYLLFPKIKQFKVVVMLHNNIANALQNKFKWLFLKRMINLVDTCIVLEEFQKTTLIERFNLDINNIRVVNNVIPSRSSISSLPHNSMRIHFVGSASSYKGFELFIDALRMMPDEFFHRAKVGIYGKIHASIEKELQDLSNKVEIVNKYLSREEYLDYCSKANFLVLPYTHVFKARVSAVFYDAVSFGIPVICSDIDVYNYYFNKYDKLGIQFREGNATDLQRALFEAVNLSEKEYLQMSNIVKKLLHNYSDSKRLMQMKTILQEIGE